MNAWRLAQKDLAVYFRDRAGVLLGFGLPVVLATVFGMAMGAVGGGGGMPRAELAVEDRDRSEASRALIAELQGSRALRVALVATDEEDRDEADSARARVEGGEAPAGLLVPAGYGAALERGELPALVLYRDPGKAIEQQVVLGGLLPPLLAAGGERLGRHAVEEGLAWLDFPPAGRERAQALLEQTWSSMHALVAEVATPPQAHPGEGPGSPVTGSEPGTQPAGEAGGRDLASALPRLLGLEVEDVVGGNDERDAQRAAQQAHAVSGIAVMMLLFGLTACGGTLLQEEAEGTLDRLRLAPGAARAILGGKFLFTWIVGLTQLLILFLYAGVIFDVPLLRAPVALALLSGAVAAAATGFGVLFAALCRTQKQLEGLSTIVILTMSALGGSWWPLAITPEWYQALAHFTLTAWAMDGYQALFWYGKGLPDVLDEIGVLLAIAAACGLLALHVWNRRQRA